jgi:hypothetical protein
LSRPSRYPATINAFNGPALADALNATNGDLWRAMENTGMVRAGLAAGPPQAVFDALPDLERRQRRGVFRTHRHAMPGDVALSFCKILCICHPG